MEKHLKDRSYYENEYDNRMIRACIDIERSSTFKNPKNEEEEYAFRVGRNLYILGTKHEYYVNRDKRIEASMERDRGIDEFYENTHAPEEKYCRYCNERLTYFDKDMDISYDAKKPHRMLFFYRCDACKKKEFIYDNGERYEFKKDYCKECGEIIVPVSSKEGDIITDSFDCKNCGCHYTEELDLSLPASNRKDEVEITEEYIKRYGYNREEQISIIQSFAQAEELHEALNESEEKEKDKELYEEVKSLNKLNIAGIRKLISSHLEDTEFEEFKLLDNKQVKRGIEVEFQVFYDGEFGEKSIGKLQELLFEATSKTNWDIRKSSFEEKLGIIKGKIIGYDSEDDLIRLIKKRK